MFFAGLYFMTGRNCADWWEKLSIEISFYPADCTDYADFQINCEKWSWKNVFFVATYFMTGRNYTDLWEKLTVEISFYSADCADSAGNLPHRFHRFSQINFEKWSW